MRTEPITVTATVSEPFTVLGTISGTWRPMGRQRDYRATVNGTAFHHNNKATFQSAIRAHLYRAGHRGAVRFDYHPEEK